MVFHDAKLRVILEMIGKIHEQSITDIADVINSTQIIRNMYVQRPFATTDGRSHCQSKSSSPLGCG